MNLFILLIWIFMPLTAEILVYLTTRCWCVLCWGQDYFSKLKNLLICKTHRILRVLNKRVWTWIEFILWYVLLLGITRGLSLQVTSRQTVWSVGCCNLLCVSSLNSSLRSQFPVKQKKIEVSRLLVTLQDAECCCELLNSILVFKMS